MSEAAAILRQAADIVEGPRQRTHGDVEHSFALAARYWSLRLGVPVDPVAVADCLGLFKLVRSQCGSPHPDHYVDRAGYAGIAGQLAGMSRTDSEQNC